MSSSLDPGDTTEGVPSEARASARVLLLSEQAKILLLEAENPDSGHRFWIAPGGGLRSGEDFEAAARRELLEETGLAAPIGPWVWTRRHIYQWRGERHDQYERYFVARGQEQAIRPRRKDGYVVGHRWWTLLEIEGADASRFAPRRLGELLPDVVRGRYPSPAIDCGV